MLPKVFNSSTGTKVLIGISGLALVAFLILHLAGNVTFLAGPDTFNSYSHKLTGTPLIFIFEAGLLAVFLLHLIKAFTNYFANRKARGPQGYVKVAGGHLTQKKPNAGSRKTLASSSSILTGTTIIAFVVIHLMGLKFGPSEHYIAQDGTHLRDLFQTQVKVFAEPGNVLLYVVAVGFIGMHLWHGIWSSFQSLGILNTRFAPGVVRAGQALSLIITLGFMFFPIYTFANNATLRAAKRTEQSTPHEVQILPRTGPGALAAMTPEGGR